MCVVGFVLNALVMRVGTKITGLHYLISQIFAVGEMVCWNLFVSYLWVFNKRSA